MWHQRNWWFVSCAGLANSTLITKKVEEIVQSHLDCHYQWMNLQLWFRVSNNQIQEYLENRSTEPEAYLFNQIFFLIFYYHCQEIKKKKVVLDPYIHCNKEKLRCWEDYSNWVGIRICVYVFCSWCMYLPHSTPNSKLSYIFILHRKWLEKEKIYRL